MYKKIHCFLSLVHSELAQSSLIQFYQLILYLEMFFSFSSDIFVLHKQTTNSNFYFFVFKLETFNMTWNLKKNIQQTKIIFRCHPKKYELDRLPMECLASKEKRKVYRIECCETDFCNNNKLLDMATYARGIHTKQSFRFKPIRHYINYFW